MGSALEDQDRHTRIRSALKWDNFEAWCASNGMASPSTAGAPVELVAAYITFLAANGHTVATVARALLQARPDHP